MSADPADELRRRARQLRQLAQAIESSPVMTLDVGAGEDTWVGARPHWCVSRLRRDQQRLHVAADDLRWTALRFEQRAAELDRSRTPHPSGAR